MGLATAIPNVHMSIVQLWKLEDRTDDRGITEPYGK